MLQNCSNSLWLLVAKEVALVAETAVWPIPVLINIFTAIKGSQFYFYFTCFVYRCFGHFLNGSTLYPSLSLFHILVKLRSNLGRIAVVNHSALTMDKSKPVMLKESAENAKPVPMGDKQIP